MIRPANVGPYTKPKGPRVRVLLDKGQYWIEEERKSSGAPTYWRPYTSSVITRRTWRSDLLTEYVVYFSNMKDAILAAEKLVEAAWAQEPQTVWYTGEDT